MSYTINRTGENIAALLDSTEQMQTTKQDKLFAGKSITIDGNVISAESGMTPEERAELASHEARLANLEAAAQGKLYREEVDDTEAYIKTVPAGALPYASLTSIGGKTMRWNQLVKTNDYDNTSYGVKITRRNGLTTLSGTKTGSARLQLASAVPAVVGHKYYLRKKNYYLGDGNTCYFLFLNNDAGNTTGYQPNSTASTKGDISVIYTAIASYFVFSTITTQDAVCDITMGISIIDLTAIYGEGNEPTTTEDPRIAELERIAEARPQYDAGSLISADVSSVDVRGANIVSGDMVREGLSKAGVKNVSGNDVQVIAATVRDKVIISDVFKPNTQYTIILCSRQTNGTGNVGNSNFVVYYTDGSRTIVQMRKTTEMSYYATITDAGKTIASLSGYSQIESAFRIDPDRFGIFEGIRTVDDFKPYSSDTYPIPESIRSLPGYGESNGDKVNTVDFENGVYHKAGSYVDGEWFDDVQDIELPESFDAYLPVETDGEITFENEAKLSVPSSVTYAINVQEAIANE